MRLVLLCMVAVLLAGCEDDASKKIREKAQATFEAAQNARKYKVQLILDVDGPFAPSIVVVEQGVVRIEAKDGKVIIQQATVDNKTVAVVIPVEKE